MVKKITKKKFVKKEIKEEIVKNLKVGVAKKKPIKKEIKLLCDKCNVNLVYIRDYEYKCPSCNKGFCMM